MSRRIQTIVLEGVLAVLGITTVFPFVWMLFSAFKLNWEIVSLHQSLLPQEWTLENFTGLQDKFDFLRFFLNSLGVALVITAVTIYTSCLCGYVLAKYRFRGRNAVFGFILGTMMIPWAVIIIPRYSMFASWGLRDHYIALILPAALSGFGIFMFRQSMSDIPDAILEAVRINDGKNSRIRFQPAQLIQNRHLAAGPVPRVYAYYFFILYGRRHEQVLRICRKNLHRFRLGALRQKFSHLTSTQIGRASCRERV